MIHESLIVIQELLNIENINILLILYFIIYCIIIHKGYINIYNYKSSKLIINKCNKLLNGLTLFTLSLHISATTFSTTYTDLHKALQLKKISYDYYQLVYYYTLFIIINVIIKYNYNMYSNGIHYFL